MKRFRLIAIIALVAGIPIGVIVLTFARQIIDIGFLDGKNPTETVATRLMGQVHDRLVDAAGAIRIVAADPEWAQGDDPGPLLAGYRSLTDVGPFRLLAVDFGDGIRASMPMRFPDGLPVPWRGGLPGGVSGLIEMPRGGYVVAVAAPVDGAGGRNGWLLGLVEVERLLGSGLMQHMGAARDGESFLVDGGGRVFVSANPSLLGRNLAELGWEDAGEQGRWVDPDGSAYWVAVAGDPGYFPAPQREWRAGVLIPEQTVLDRNRQLKGYVIAVIGAILVITAGLAALLRRSIRGRSA